MPGEIFVQTMNDFPMIIGEGECFCLRHFLGLSRPPSQWRMGESPIGGVDLRYAEGLCGSG